MFTACCRTSAASHRRSRLSVAKAFCLMLKLRPVVTLLKEEEVTGSSSNPAIFAGTRNDVWNAGNLSEHFSSPQLPHPFTAQCPSLRAATQFVYGTSSWQLPCLDTGDPPIRSPGFSALSP